MQPEVGEILEGKVTGITKFGAFVLLPNGRSGLVHISEIANTFVSEVSQFLSVGQTVKVKVLAVTEEGKINLSMKKAEDPAPAQASPRPARPGAGPRPGGTAPRPRQAAPAQPAAEPSFEDRLKQFMQESDSKNSGNRLYANRKNTARRRRD